MFEVAFVSLGVARGLAWFGLFAFFPGQALRMMGRDPAEPEVWPFTKWWARTVGFCCLTFLVIWCVDLLFAQFENAKIWDAR